MLYRLFTTPEFEDWLKAQPGKLRVMIKARLDLLTLGHFGDFKRFDGLLEFRWKNGTRVYALIKSHKLIVILYGGNKNGQTKDINKAKALSKKILPEDV